jgi:hypothetical protein
MSSLDHQAALAAPDVERCASFERRSHGRRDAMGRVARIDALGLVGLARLRNMSNGGAMISVHAPLACGGPVRISFDCTNSIQGRIAWSTGGRAGIRFLAPIDCAAFIGKVASDRGTSAIRAPRLPVNCAAWAKGPGGSFPTIVSNISETGLKICHGGSLPAGTTIEISFGRDMKLAGTVRWSNGHFAGVELERRLAPEDLANARQFPAWGLRAA